MEHSIVIMFVATLFILLEFCHQLGLEIYF